MGKQQRDVPPVPREPVRLQLSWRGTFNGYIDELTLWNRSMSQGETRTLRFLDRGLNGIVVPRVLFF